MARADARPTRKKQMSAGCLIAGPRIGFENLLERGMAHNLMCVHGSPDVFGNLGKVYAAIDEGFDGDFVGGVQNGGKCATDFAGFASELKGGEAFKIRFFESEAAELGEVGLDAIARSALGISKRVLDGQAHVGCGKLREHRAIDEFDH